MSLKKYKQNQGTSWLFSSVLTLLILLIFAIVGSMDQIPNDVNYRTQIAGGERY